MLKNYKSLGLLEDYLTYLRNPKRFSNQRNTNNANLIFRFDRIEKTLEVLKEKNIPLLSADKIMGK